MQRIPNKILQVWEKAYPGIKNISENLRQCGYRVIGHFTLPGNADVLAIINMYREYYKRYGCVF
ncbi:MAG TPA: hypothetical protein DCL60_12100 [Armatimonadetes bacterium]|nr:hypothetical protein [Armatimonadota bacterium]